MLAIAFLVPLVVFRGSNDAFELPKQALLRVVLVASLLSAAALAFTPWRGSRASSPSRPLALSSHRLRSILGWPPALAALAVVAAWSLSTTLSVAPEVSWWGNYQRWAGLRMQLAYVALFLVAAATLTRREQMVRLAAVTAAAASLASLYAISQRLGWDPFAWNWGELGLWQTTTSQRERPFSFFGNPNFLAAYLTLSLFVTLGGALARWPSGKPRRPGARPVPPLAFWLLAAAALLQAVVLLLTQTRSAWVGTAAGLGAFGLLMSLQRGWLSMLARRRALWGSLAAGVALVLLAGGLLLGRAALPSQGPPGGASSVAQETGLGGLLARAASIFNPAEATVSLRLLLWQAGLQLAQERPLLGFGPDTTGSVMVRRYTPDLAVADNLYFVIDRAHNAVVDTLVTVGVLGLLALLAVAAAVALAGWRLLLPRKAPSAESARADGAAGEVPQPPALAGHPLAAAVLAALAAHVVEQQFNLGVVGFSFLAWTLAGAVAGCAWGGPRLPAPLAVAAAERAEPPPRRAAQQPSDGGGRPAPGARRRPRRRDSLTWRHAALAVPVLGLVAAFAWWELLPLRADTFYAQGLGAERDGRWQASAQLIGQGIAIWPREPAYWNELGKVRFELARRAQGSAAQQLYEQAVAAADEAVRLNPSSALLWSNLGLVAGEAAARAGDSQLMNRALQAHALATDLAPDYWLYHRNAGATQLEAGDPAAAQQSFQLAITLSKNTEGTLWAALSQAASAAGDEATASQARERAPKR